MSARAPRLLRRALSTTRTTRDAQSSHSASAKLFADAAAEESAPRTRARPPRIPQAVRDAENWTGDERVEDTVLRMLVDKYQPLRTGEIRSADDKLRASPPKISTASGSELATSLAENIEAAKLDGSPIHDGSPTPTASTSTPTYATSTAAYQPSPFYKADTPLLASVEGHRPWHTTYVAPSHASSSIKYGAISTEPRRAPKVRVEDLDEKARRRLRETEKRAQAGRRLTSARESTLDYKLGARGKMPGGGRPNPTSVKAWAGLVEDRIERARQAGHFNNVKGRGQPIRRESDEGNPYIAREEFLMNRIVQRQGAAPPWVELQGELELALASYRELLRQSWARRVVRMLPLHNTPAALARLTLDAVREHRDPDWLAREKGYHTVAIDELNALVRKYNGVAPSSVRRPYYVLNAELERAYHDGAEEILTALAERASASPRPLHGHRLDDEGGGGGGAGGDGAHVGFWDVVFGWFRREPKRADH